jgi:hypothetical protein
MATILTKEKRDELRARAQGRMKQYGQAAVVKMLCSEVIACVDTVDAVEEHATARVSNAGKAMATAKDERAEAGRLAEESLAAQNKANEAMVKLEAAVTELGLLRRVLAEAELKGRKGLNDAIKAYREVYPDLTGSSDGASDGDENSEDDTEDEETF